MLYSQSPPLADEDAVKEESPHEFGRGGRDAHPEPQFGRRPAPAPIYVAPPRRSLGRRMFRALMKFVILVGIGVGGTLGWQAYGDMAKQMLAEYAPEQAWLLSYLPSTRPPAAVARAANPAPQLEPLAANLASSVEYVRRSVEQLALKQEQMARSIVALQAVDEDIRQKIASPPPAPSPVAAQAAMPQPKPAAPKPLPPPGAPAAPRPSTSAGPVSLVPR
jgi:hypothetical protein